jgi:hypothetical protein
MIFLSLILTENGVVTAKAEGHASDVVKAFHEVCGLLLTTRGPWRIVEVAGVIDDGSERDSEMTWNLTAKSKGV